MTAPPRRFHARYPCRLQVRAFTYKAVSPAEGEAVNIGVGGALLRLKGSLADASVRLEVNALTDWYTLDAKLLRRLGSDPRDSRYNLYGVTFIHATRSQGRVKEIVDLVRRALEAGEGRPNLTWPLA